MYGADPAGGRKSPMRSPFTLWTVTSSFKKQLVALRHADDPEPLVATGRVSGLITHEKAGDGGFGFDPVFFVPEFGCTFAQVPPEVKNAHSHRGRAVQAMLALMRERWFA